MNEAIATEYVCESALCISYSHACIVLLMCSHCIECSGMYAHNYNIMCLNLCECTYMDAFLHFVGISDIL